MRLTDKVIYFLKQHPSKQFTAREIAEWIWDTYPDDCKAKMERSTATVQPLKDKCGFLNQLGAEISSIHKNIIAKEPNIRTTEGRPRQYYYSTKSSAKSEDYIFIHSKSILNENFQSLLGNDGSSKEAQEEVRLTERDLYPLLSQYLAAEHSVHSKRINEKKSGNKKVAGGNHWRFPDLVGLEDLSGDWGTTSKSAPKDTATKRPVFGRLK